MTAFATPNSAVTAVMTACCWLEAALDFALAVSSVFSVVTCEETEVGG